MTHGRWLREGPRREARDREIVDAYLRGLPMPEIEALVGLTRVRIHNILDDNGIPRRPRPRPPYPVSAIAAARARAKVGRNEQIVAAFKAGDSKSSIAKRFGVTRQRVQQIIATQLESAAEEKKA